MKLFIIAVLSLATATAHAGSLINKDSSSYDIAVSCGGGTMKTSISGGTTKSGITSSSSSSCKITVSGVGTVEVSGSDDVEIRNGRLSVK